MYRLHLPSELWTRRGPKLYTVYSLASTFEIQSLNQSLWLLKLIRHFQKLYHHISIKSLKVDLFKDLIGKLKEIMSKKTGEEQVLEIGSASSVTDEKYTVWNELLCQIIILASFTKINQAEF